MGFDLKLMISNFLNVIQQISPLTQKEKDLLSDALIVRHIPKKFNLVEIGKISRETYFINKGCLQLFYNKDGEDATIFLATENMFLGAFTSFLTQRASLEGIRALEDCELLVLPKSALDKLYETMPKMNLIIRKIMEQRFLSAQSIVASFVLNKPEERYLQMLSQRPELFQRVPQHILATFLGITPVSLSRIRKRILEG